MNKMLRKVTRNMKNLPGALINADRKHGGLGVRSLCDEANERKLKILGTGIHGDDMTATALSGMVGRGHRVSGRGGVEDMEMKVEATLGEDIWLTSLLQWLDEMRLELKTCGGRVQHVMAMDNRMDKHEKIELNRKGIVFKGEGEEGEPGEMVPLRVRQCWMKEGRVMEIVGFSGKD